MKRLCTSVTCAALLLAKASAGLRAGDWRQSVEVLNVVNARSVALAGAVTSVPGDLEVAHINPAAIELFRYPQTFRIAVCLDAVSPAVALSDRKHGPRWDRLDVSERFAVAGVLLRALLVRWNFFDGVLRLGEDLSAFREDDPNRIRVDWHGFPNLHGHYLAGRLRLAGVVSIGASVFYAQNRRDVDVQRDYGVSYGVLVTSHEGLRFGVSYVRLPQPSVERLRWRDRLANGTVNLGLSRTFYKRWTVALDVRNLSDEAAPIVREFHVGTELVVHHHLAVRSGFFRQKRPNRNVLSVGFGLIDRNRFVSPDRLLRDRSYVIEYAVRAEFVGQRRKLTHFLNLLVRL